MVSSPSSLALCTLRLTCSPLQFNSTLFTSCFDAPRSCVLMVAVRITKCSEPWIIAAISLLKWSRLRARMSAWSFSWSTRGSASSRLAAPVLFLQLEWCVVCGPPLVAAACSGRRRPFVIAALRGRGFGLTVQSAASPFFLVQLTRRPPELIRHGLHYHVFTP